DSAFGDPSQIEDIWEVSRLVAPMLGVSARSVRDKLAGGVENQRFVWLKRRLPEEQAAAIRRADIRGIGLITEGLRVYPHGSLAAHVVGMVGKDCQGLEGIEFLFNARLRGHGGLRSVKADGRRRPLWAESSNGAAPGGTIGTQELRDGQVIVLTIDRVIQGFVEAELNKTLEKYDAKAATSIVMDPQTGEVLAMASLPTYDPNNYADYSDEARRNRAITDPYEPGSTFKVFVAGAALATGVVKMDERIFCENGLWRYRSRRIHDHHSYGWLSFQDVVVKSSNVGMAKLGVRLGGERLRRAACAFGFGSRTGIFLPGEDPGFVQWPHRWSYYTTTSVPFGQEITVTPLQLVTAFSVFANGGRLLRPKIILGALDSQGRAVADLSDQTDVVAQVMPSAVANAFRDDILVDVIARGTGRKCKIPGYRVFGKTGTAQKTAPPGSEQGGYSHELYVSSFIAGASALGETSARVVVLVVVDEPDKSKGYYGGTVAAPCVKAILEKTLAYLGVPKRKPSYDDPGRDGSPRLASSGGVR
ncbi:MAG: penicillin-binding protein 2, partial [Planctomycetia bacterium]|nr:penicillin-binding protein 2 [Planctomycetia bacterium]